MFDWSEFMVCTEFATSQWERTPFHVHNKYLFGAKAILIFMIPFWAPWIVVTYQMKKANEQLTLQKFFE
ncbi:putative cytochrome c oxidase subunit VIIc [Ancylostoma ceylanicum]|uniref:Putative cytochrome c oxidase subunit VIIc n=1 Tax=Ancylostoma ceylanicum TaxID=53326 RepID=A0A0D6LHI6_9BILA|nr:putative cytochrome c oxidase subunit VIIc [Ancylostoma ceylanicum]